MAFLVTLIMKPATRHSLRNRRYLFYLGLVLLLSIESCGFRLRGTAALPPSMSAIFIEQQQAPLIEQALLYSLTEQQLQPVSEKKLAQVVVSLAEEHYERRVLTVAASGNVQEFELNYAVWLTLKDAQDVELAKKQKLILRREMRYDSSQVLAKSGEEAQLKNEMLADAAQQIIRRLQFLDNKSLENKSLENKSPGNESLDKKSLEKSPEQKP